MFSDTHFHLPLVAQCRADFDASQFFATLCQNNCAFAQDIGTKCDDLEERISFVEKAIASLSPELAAQSRRLIHFSAGIWPDVESIKDRAARMRTLEAQIAAVTAGSPSREDHPFPAVSAVGECGIDHHWNPSGADGRCESDFDRAVLDGERELFLMQLALGARLSLPVIIHSRDGFEDTLDCIKESGYDNGVIHCFSYGKEEAECFLDRGWYISLSGSVTYTKRSKMEAMEELIRFIPADRLLLETDAPYLAPVPFRGQPNTPLFVEHTYRFVAGVRHCTVEQLCSLVDDNAASLFKNN